ncbi:MAG: transposase [Akkermansia sp.]|nr:transposase [Akkermansia sp.]
MGNVARLMQETSARLLSGILRLSQSSILRADKDILTLIDEARPICLDRRRALIIDEKYPGRDKKFVTCVIDGCSGEILWLKEGKGAASLDGFFRSLTPEQKEDIEVVSIDRGNACLKALRQHLPHVSISFDPFHIIKNANEAVDEVRRTLCKSLEENEKKHICSKRNLGLCFSSQASRKALPLSENG